MLDFVRQLGALSGEKLDAVIVVRIVRSADHDACFGMEGARQIGDGRCRHRAQEHHIGTRRRQSGLECRFEHVAGDPGVLAHQHFAGAHFAERHTRSPTELEHEIRRDRVFADATTNAVGTKVFFSHKRSIILFG
ncbi:hypothetical protein D3C87_1558120 [compost metagenome]